MRQLSDKSHSVGDQNREVFTKLNAPDQSIFLRQRPEQCGLACICITDKGHKWKLIAPAMLAMQLPMLPDLLDVAPESADPMANLPAVHFQLGFTRTACTDAATEA